MLAIQDMVDITRNFTISKVFYHFPLHIHVSGMHNMLRMTAHMYNNSHLLHWHRISFQQESNTTTAPTLNVQDSEYQSLSAHASNRTQMVSTPTNRQATQSTSTPSLVLALVKTFGWEFSVAGFYKVFQDLLLFVSPQILK